MKRIVLSLFAIACLQTVFAQTAPKLPALDKSPMDMAYYPPNYPVLKIQGKDSGMSVVARVIYSRPQKNGRSVFGTLEKYDSVYRVGANEATEIEFFKDVTIGGKKVAKGRYTLYAIPTADKWTMIINKETDTWGAYGYHQAKDLLRTEVPVTTLATPVEALTMVFQKSATGANLFIAWDTVQVALPISF
jgi:hypothetical protein